MHARSVAVAVCVATLLASVLALGAGAQIRDGAGSILGAQWAGRDPHPTGERAAPASEHQARGARHGFRFQPVAIGAGGWVTGISASNDGRTRLVRTDTAAAYRWDGDHWTSVVTSTSLPHQRVHPSFRGGVLAVAVAPSDARRAYMALDDGLYRSDDSAQTWTRVLDGVSTEPNDNFKMWGTRLAVDPRNPDVVYYGSQLDGLLVSQDAGDRWTKVSPALVPAGLVIDPTDAATRGSVTKPTEVMPDGKQLASAGVDAIAIDPASPVIAGRSSVIYAASYGSGIYRSADGGITWLHISPTDVSAVKSLRVIPGLGVVATSTGDPTAIGGNDDVYRLQGLQWQKVTPSTPRPWQALAVDPRRSSHIVVMAPGGYLAVSDDVGGHWTQVARTQASTGDVPWLSWALNGGTNWMSVGELMFDPVVNGRLWFAEGTGVWFADVLAPVAHWQSQSRGIEQLVPTDIAVPPHGKPVMTAWDRPIFRSRSPAKYPASYGPVNGFGSAWSVDWSAKEPRYLVASVASHQWPSDPVHSGFSNDGGRTWTDFKTLPGRSTNAVTTFGFGSVAVGRPGNIVWVPSYGHRPYFTKNNGRTWRPVRLPGVRDYSVVDPQPHYVYRRVVTADRVQTGTFYLLVEGKGVFRTTDGGKTWRRRSGFRPFAHDAYDWHAILKAVPGQAGELYATPGQLAGETGIPLRRSTDGGRTWQAVPRVTGVTAIGFGATVRGRTRTYVAGYVHGKYGVYRSVDGWKHWVRLTVYPARNMATVQSIDATKSGRERVYLSMTGSGWVYGEPRHHSRR